MQLMRLETDCGEIFERVVAWNYRWWGVKNGDSEEKVRYLMAHSVCTDRLPQTFVALMNGNPVGMYQLSMSDDLYGRPDIYPWLINVYVDEAHRGKQVCRYMMETVAEKARDIGLSELYLYTSHVGLYEKFGWEFLEEVPSFQKEHPIQRLYGLKCLHLSGNVL